MPAIAKIAVPISLDKEFDYLIPSGMKAEKGMRALVDFNGRKSLGLVTGLTRQSKFKNLKQVLDILDKEPLLSDGHMRFAELLSGIYPYAKADFLFMMLPPALKRTGKLKVEGVKAVKEECLGRAAVKFIKADSFVQRYRLWKDELKERLKKGSVLICFPQLSYLKAAEEILKKDFSENLQVIYSQKKEKGLVLAWQKSRANALILGTRVSIFYYPSDLKLIIVEEENSPYYFQEEKPYHNLLDVALELSRFKGADLILSSDFPSLRAYKLIKDKKITLEDKGGAGRRIKVVARAEFGKKRVISPVLIELLKKSLRENKKAVVLWNRKGFTRFIKCSACGHAFKCSRCSGFLRLSLNSDEGVCPYCQKKAVLPKICPHCKDGYLKNSGYGIERIENTLKRDFPEVKIDGWQARGPNSKVILATSEILSSLYGGETFDTGFVLDADYSLARADYEAVFNTFLYLKKLSFFFKDELNVFTGNKNYYLFEYLNKGWESFYKAEMSLRKKLFLPPFGLIVKITLRSKNKNSLLKQAQNLYNKLEQEEYHVYGPLEEEPFKLRDKFRYSVIVKTKRNFAARKAIKERLKKIRLSAQTAVSLK